MSGRGLTRFPAAAAAVVMAIALACGESLAPLSSPASPEQLRVRAVGVSVVRLTWLPVDSAVSYRVERRADHQGAFQPLPGTVPQTPELIVFLDTDVEPETYYGYRVVAVSRFGDASRPSVVGGTRTPPPPGIVVATHSEAPVPSAADPDGYRVTIVGPDTTAAVISTTTDRRFAPLKPGTYSVTLRGVIPRCRVVDDSTRNVTVPDSGVNTLMSVSYTVRCRDPQRGNIVGIVSASGDSLDANGFQLQLTGILADPTLPDSLKLVTQTASVQPSGATAPFENLKPGAYELELKSVDSHCTREGTATRSVNVIAGSIDTVRFVVRCESVRPDNSNRPLVWRNAWSAASAPAGSKVNLLITIDASARNELKIGSVDGEIRYGDKLRYDSAQAAPGTSLAATPNGNIAGLVTLSATDNDGVGLSGTIGVARLHFTVTGAAPGTAATRTAITELVHVISPGVTREYKDSTYAVEDTLTIGGSGGTTPVAPVANANGPYTGTAGTAITFVSAGSSDPDGGSIVSYAWTFGDNTTSTQASPSKSYATAGSFPVTLTVTDDEGATAAAQTTATITGTSTGPPPPPPPANKPLVLRNVWSAPAAAGQTVQLTLTLDATARPQLKVGSTDALVKYDTTALRYVRTLPITPNGFDVTGNANPGGVASVTGTAPAGLSGTIGVAKFEFTVLDATKSVATLTTVPEIADNNLSPAYTDSVHIVEDTLTPGGGGTTPPPPPPEPAKPLIWRYSFSGVMQPTPDSNVVVMEVLYDMSADVAESPAGIETLNLWKLDSLKWNNSVLTFVKVSWGPGMGGAEQAFPGKLILNGSIGATSPFRSGLILLATIRFKVVGTAGQSTATQTWVSMLKNAPPASFNYIPFTEFREATFTIP